MKLKLSVETGQVHTQNCDGHPLLGLMHKPDPNLPPDKQDKRSVVPIEKKDWDAWLHGTTGHASDLIQVPAIDLFRHGVADPAQSATLPI